MPKVKQGSKFKSENPFRVVAGSYVRLLYGLDAKLEGSDSNVDKRYTLSPSFIYPAHRSSIKCCATDPKGKYLATGSTDESIKVYDSRRKKEIGTLVHHSGTVSCLLFWDSQHLISGGEEGGITLWRTSDWAELKTLIGHEGAITSMAMHPTGSILLSVAKDGTLKCWDLVNGKLAHSVRLIPKSLLAKSKLTGVAGTSPLAGEPLKVCWASDRSFVVMYDWTIQIFDLEKLGAVHGSVDIKAPTRLNALIKLDDSHLLIGGEDSFLYSLDIASQTIRKLGAKHPSRIKDIATLDLTNIPDKELSVVASCSSDGVIQCFLKSDLLAAPKNLPVIASYDAKVRLTCLAVSPVFHARSGAAKSE